jgi:hypothetical protein
LLDINHEFSIHGPLWPSQGHIRQGRRRVDYRQEIAKRGSSDRSTGPHIHYEVRVNGNTYDPMNLLEAGKYVFKG